MHKIYTAAQAQQIDEHTIKTIGIPSLVLMERAAQGVTKRVLGIIKEEPARPVICVCGKGNNGADGMAVARQLFEHGVNVYIYLCGTSGASKTSAVKTDFETQLDICHRLDFKFLKRLTIPKDAIIVDAIFGNGLDREVGGIYKDIIKKINDSGAYVVAIDIPSGIAATTGHILGTAVRADETVTFGAERLGHVLYPGAAHTGRLTVENIGWQTEQTQPSDKTFYMLDGEELKLIPERYANSHKGSFGKALIIAGSKEFGGAAVLAAKAAFAAGAGLVRVYTHEDNRTPLLSSVPEAIASVYDKEDFKLENISEALSLLEEQVKSADIIAIGSGIGKSEAAEKILDYVIKCAACPLILDADALNLMAEGRVKSGVKKKRELTITPHIKEAAGLLGVSVCDIEADMTGACLKLSKKYNASVILKSAVTVITDGSEVFINKGGNSGMACAGSGDVLTGLLAGLAAQGLKGKALSAAGVYLHAAAGALARERAGEYGMTPSDIADCAGDVLKSRVTL